MSSPTTPRTETLRLCGRRSVGCPLRRTSSMRSVRPVCRRSRSARQRGGWTSSSFVTISAAAAKPTTPAGFSVPERRPRSCPPPCVCGTSFTPRRTYRAPVPFGPPILWAENAARSTPSALTSTWILPSAWTASVNVVTPRSRHADAISATGSIVPISLFASITQTRIVSSRSRSRTASGDSVPVASTGRNSISKPRPASHSAESSTAWCSILGRRMCLPLDSFAHAAPFTARLSASVPPPVNTTSSGAEPIASASFSRASSTPLRASRPVA